MIVHILSSTDKHDHSLDCVSVAGDLLFKWGLSSDVWDECLSASLHCAPTHASIDEKCMESVSVALRCVCVFMCMILWVCLREVTIVAMECIPDMLQFVSIMYVSNLMTPLTGTPFFVFSQDHLHLLCRWLSCVILWCLMKDLWFWVSAYVNEVLVVRQLHFHFAY